jgi:hypothetical protein
MAEAKGARWVRILAGSIALLLHQLDQHRDVFAVVADSRLDGQVLVHRRADREVVQGLGIGADDGEGPGLGQGLDPP